MNVRARLVVMLLLLCIQEVRAEEPSTRSESHFRHVFNDKANAKKVTTPRKEFSKTLASNDVPDSAKEDAVIAVSASSKLDSVEQFAVLSVVKSASANRSLRVAGVMCLLMCLDESTVDNHAEMYNDIIVIAQYDPDLDLRRDACQMLMLSNRGKSVMTTWLSIALSTQNSNKDMVSCLDILTNSVKPDGPLTWEDVVLWAGTLADHRAASASTREKIARCLYINRDFMEESVSAELHRIGLSQLETGVTTLKGIEYGILLLSPNLPIPQEAETAIRSIAGNKNVPAEMKSVAEDFLQSRTLGGSD